MAASIIELKNVSTVYEGERVPAIRDIDLTIESGEFVAIIGPNGAGKTTLLETINGLLPHTRGQVRVLGQDVARFGPQLRSQIGYVPQEFQFDETTPVLVRDVVLMGRYGRIGLFRRPTAEDYVRVQEALELLGLAELAERPLGKLSGGQQQKVLLARALAKEPKILLLDEPFSYLDCAAREEVAELIARWHRERSLTVLIVLHDLEAIPRSCHRVVLLNGGRILHDGARERVVRAFTLAHKE
jgi:zinc/manganese transport system ATP-binding protein